MDLENFVKQIVENKTRKDDYLKCADEVGIDVPKFFNRVSLYIAHSFINGSMPYDYADCAMNEICPEMTDYCIENDIPLIEPCFQIYVAFDLGEYTCKDGCNLVKKHTRPSLEKILGTYSIQN